MPIPAILGIAAAAGASILGLGAQLDAKDKNELAQQIANEAKELYDSAKSSLENTKAKSEKSLVQLGSSKKKVLDTSVRQFLDAYNRVKHITLSESVGIDEVKNLSIDAQGVVELKKMCDIYESTISSGVAGAATGALISLAASGTLPMVTTLMSGAGTALAAGEIGLAASTVGSALSFGASMTPLAAFVAPAVLFSGISSNIKAEENLEKARAMQAQAEAAVEEMKTSEVLCNAIADRADMFDSLLNELNKPFSQCTALLDAVTKKKMGLFKNKIITEKDLTEDDCKLIAATRALAGAMKAVIDTPILTADGTVSQESQEMYDSTKAEMPKYINDTNALRNAYYSQKSTPKPSNTNSKSKTSFVEDMNKKKKSFTILSPILGLIAIFMIYPTPFVSIATSLFGFVIGIKSLKKSKKAIAIAGILLNGCVLLFFLWFIYAVLTGSI